MMESFQDISETIRFITQPHAAFLSLEWHQQSRLRIGDYLIACHIEETLTVSQLYYCYTVHYSHRADHLRASIGRPPFFHAFSSFIHTWRRTGCRF